MAIEDKIHAQLNDALQQLNTLPRPVTKQKILCNALSIIVLMMKENELSDADKASAWNSLNTLATTLGLQIVEIEALNGK